MRCALCAAARMWNPKAWRSPGVAASVFSLCTARALLRPVLAPAARSWPGSSVHSGPVCPCCPGAPYCDLLGLRCA